MQNDMRDRLVELVEDSLPNDNRAYFTKDIQTMADELIANGVILLPCKVGDKIYQTDGVSIYESMINEITFTTHKTIYVTENIVFDETAVGKSIFLTREEAEQALKIKEKG